jgi:hypothetical protein
MGGALMAIPDNSNDLRTMGYTYDGEGTCRGCKAKLEWWITPRDKKMSMSTKIVGTLAEGNRREVLEPHWGVCPNADDFRR